MVAVHPFDLHGAKLAGLQTAWVRRQDVPPEYPSYYESPDITVPSFLELAAELERHASGA